MTGIAHVIGYYAANDPREVAALEVQACTNCGAILWRRGKGSDPFPPWRRIGVDCVGTMEDGSMAKRQAREGKLRKARKPRPEQAELPGTEDSAIAPLEAAAKAYARVRDERMELTLEESKRKGALIPLMHKHGKTTYRRHGIEIDLVPEAESVKVKIRKPGDENGDGGDE